MFNRKVYLKSYDTYDDVLEYHVSTGAARRMTRTEFEAQGMSFTFGDFTRERWQVMGVFASPEGPVFFLDSVRVLGYFGEIDARLVRQIDDDRTYHFTLSVGGQVKFRFAYRARLGIGANPYDNELEDVDLAALIATGVRSEQFFKIYTRDWIET